MVLVRTKNELASSTYRFLPTKTQKFRARECFHFHTAHALLAGVTVEYSLAKISILDIKLFVIDQSGYVLHSYWSVLTCASIASVSASCGHYYTHCTLVKN